MTIADTITLASLVLPLQCTVALALRSRHGRMPICYQTQYTPNYPSMCVHAATLYLFQSVHETQPKTLSVRMYIKSPLSLFA